MQNGAETGSVAESPENNAESIRPTLLREMEK